MFTYDFHLNKNDKNTGTVYLPSENVINIPVIVYCHGWKGRRNLWTPTEKLCEIAIENNIALVTFDFFGCGETGGDYKKMTYRRWKENLSDVIDYVGEQPFANKDKIGCYAFSSGSTAAFRLAAEDNRISFLVAVGSCLTSNFFMNSGSPAKWLSDNVEALSKGELVNDFGIDFCRDAVSHAPVHSIKNIKCPVLFLQGLSDNIFRITDARIGFELIKTNGGIVKHIEINDGAHELENVIDIAMEDMFAWLLPIINTQQSS